MFRILPLQLLQKVICTGWQYRYTYLPTSKQQYLQIISCSNFITAIVLSKLHLRNFKALLGTHIPFSQKTKKKKKSGMNDIILGFKDNELTLRGWHTEKKILVFFKISVFIIISQSYVRYVHIRARSASHQKQYLRKKYGRATI